MEISETIQARIVRLNNLITSKYVENEKLSLIKRESLLETLQCLYEECCVEQAKKHDRNIGKFVEKYKQTLDELKKLRINLNDFDIKHLIGRGQFGEVYIVNEKQTGDIYAMKMIKKINCLKQTDDQFINERNIMAYTQSQWLTRLKYSFQDNIYLFFIMDYHPGGNLMNLLLNYGGTIPEIAAVFYLAEILLAINDLHNFGYIHRDIKPENILLDRCGHVKLVDFGSSIRYNQKNGLILNNNSNDNKQICGTPNYIAPEVLQSMNTKNSTYGVSCDLWSLGVIAYELTIGKQPFIGQNTTEIYAKILNFKQSLKYPSDTLLTQSYINLINNLLIDDRSRLTIKQLFKHKLFKNINFDTMNEQIPPFIPKVLGNDDRTNFPLELIQNKKRSSPNIENFQRRKEFTGRNLPFLNFNFIKDDLNLINNNDNNSDFNRTKINNNDGIVTNLRKELDETKKILIKNENFENIKINLEKQLIERTQKLENIEIVRDQLEKDLANCIAECTALKRTLEIERKDRTELETKALELIKTTKIKWELNEKQKFDKLNLEINEYKERINELSKTNELLTKQLQDTIKQENDKKTNKIIKTEIENYQRKSILSLEQRLDTITNDNLDKMNELQMKLNYELNNREILENSLKQYRKNEEILLEKLEKTQQEFNNFNQKIDDSETIIKELNLKINKLENLIETNEIYKNDNIKLKQQLNDLHQNNRDLEQQLNQSNNDNRQQIDDNKKQIQSMNEEICELQQKLNDYQLKLTEEQQKYEKLLDDYQNQQKEIDRNKDQDRDIHDDERNELRELRVKYWRLEKDLNNCKIDKRILERELKEQQQQLLDNKTKLEQLNNQLIIKQKDYDNNLIELGNINEKLSLELIGYRENYGKLNEKYERKLKEFNDNQLKLNEFNDIVLNRDNRIRELSNTIDNKEKFIDKLNREKSEIINDFNRFKQEKQQLTNELETTKQQLNNTKLNWEALHEACQLLESQIIEYEKITKNVEFEKFQLNKNYEKLLNDYKQLNDNILLLKKQINEEKSLKLLSETKLKKSETNYENLLCEKQTIQEQYNDLKQLINNLNEQLITNENKLINCELLIKTNERDLKKFKDENRLLKEDLSQYLTQIDNLKQQNYKFKQQIKEAQIMETTYLQQIEELELNLKTQINYYEEKQLKNDSTIKQQIKLIDYLHSKLDEYGQKKRTLADKLFGSTKNQQQNYKNEIELQKLQEINKNLRDELEKLRLEIDCNSQLKIKQNNNKQLDSQIIDNNSQLKNKQNNNRQLDSQENQHKFETRTIKTVFKCDNCNKQILLGHDYNICLNCNLIIHNYCKKNGQLCGKNDNIDNNVMMEGWLKLFKNNWTKFYCNLTNQQFNIYSNSNKSELIESIKIDNTYSNNNKIILEPTDYDNNELVIQVLMGQISLLLMVETVGERDQWYNGFECVFFGKDSNYGELILDLNDHHSMKINKILQLTKSILLIGTDNGFYSYYDNNLLSIDNNLIINDLQIIETLTLKFVLLLTENCVYYCDLNHLINLIQCSITNHLQLKFNYQRINLKNSNNIHLLKVSTIIQHELLCIATKKQLIIVKYRDNNFITLRTMDTAEPTSCVLFNDNNMIVGSDKFFQIDLNSFKAIEFLQPNDLLLDKCQRLRTLPLDIIKIGNNPIEYLLCFCELLIVVNDDGCLLRQLPIDFQHLPLNFYYFHHYLFLHHLYGFSVYKLNDNCVLIDNIRILNDFRVIGNNNRGVYLLLDNKIRYYSINYDLLLSSSSSILTTTSEFTNNSDLDAFSFTSSMVQSLDDYPEVDKNEHKHVKFLPTTNL